MTSDPTRYAMASRNRSAALTASIAAAASVLAIVGTWNYLDLNSTLRQRVTSRKVSSRKFKDRPSLAALELLTQEETLKETYPIAGRVEKNIPVYDAETFDLTTEDFVERLQDEFHHCLLHGPGVFVVKHFANNLALIDEVNETFADIIAREKTENGSAGDHFAAAGTNSRIWNSFSKHALSSPTTFIPYYSNPLFRIVSESWLGPAYRLTAQVNIVHPGGQPQQPHRDYHLGFQTAEDVKLWPKEMQVASQLLTLQGALAHTDMPLESGPTRFLVGSQRFAEGFEAYRLPEFKEYFEKNWVSLPLTKGDAVFFNPAVFHAAGENQMNNFSRSANLIQISSAFGKTMEKIETMPIVEATWDVMVAKFRSEKWSAEMASLVAAVGEGYPFPTNLDRRPPAPGGMAPESEQDVIRRALEQGRDREQVMEELRRLEDDARA